MLTATHDMAVTIPVDEGPSRSQVDEPSTRRRLRFVPRRRR